MKFLDWFRFITLSKSWRIIKHVEYLKENVHIKDKADKQSFKNIYNLLIETRNKLRFYNTIKISLYALLYASAVTAIVQGINPIYGWLLTPLNQLASAIGFTVLAILAALFTKIADTVFTDLLSQHSHLLALAVKHSENFVAKSHHVLGLVEEYG